MVSAKWMDHVPVLYTLSFSMIQFYFHTYNTFHIATTLDFSSVTHFPN